MEETPLGESIRTSCERCRRRKIRCDRKRPCSRCVKAGTECLLEGSGEKQRPVSKSYVQALEGQIASLEMVIRKLATATNEERSEILAAVPVSSSRQTEDLSPDKQSESSTDPALITARLRAGQLRRPRESTSAQFFGGTSLFQIHLSKDASLPSVSDDLEGSDLGKVESHSDANIRDVPSVDAATASVAALDMDAFSPQSGVAFQYAPHDEVSQQLMATFFQEQYQYHMVVYREYFLRDYDVGSGRYYSDLLLYSICALGALQYDEMRSFSDIFSGQAQALLYPTFDSPDITTLQGLVLLGYREIAVGHASKGWLFCGMAFRLAHEMGLHLDPNNWDGSSESLRDREILRRVYWAVFIADKQLSLYFGRPPVLHPNESDVRNTIRLQYPQDWQGLLETYICSTAVATEYEDSVALVGAFIYQAELSKIIHVMITDLFENRRGDMDPAVAATKSHKIHVSLTKWLMSLPGTLHWNQWTVGRVPSSVLHLHMLFHTVMIILHRPPSHLFENESVSDSEDVQICYESLQAILRLMHCYSRFYRYRSLPLDFVHILSTAAGTIMMKRYFQHSSWDDPDIEKPLSLVIKAMEDIENTWPCIREIKDCVKQARRTQISGMPLEDPLQFPDLMNGLELGSGSGSGPDSHSQFSSSLPDLNEMGDELGLGTLLTDEFLSTHVQMAQPELNDFNFNISPT